MERRTALWVTVLGLSVHGQVDHCSLVSGGALDGTGRERMGAELLSSGWEGKGTCCPLQGRDLKPSQQAPVKQPPLWDQACNSGDVSDASCGALVSSKWHNRGFDLLVFAKVSAGQESYHGENKIL